MLPHHKCVREICDFANATGGIILIGVEDDGEIVGVGKHNKLKSQVQSIARSAEPPIAVDVESIGMYFALLCLNNIAIHIPLAASFSFAEGQPHSRWDAVISASFALRKG